MNLTYHLRAGTAVFDPFKTYAPADAALSAIRHPESGIGLIADDFGGSGRVRLEPGADIARWLTTGLQFVRSLVA